MKSTKCALFIALLTTLIGCGHGYEGEYQSGIEYSNEYMNKVAGSAVNNKIILGKDYVVSQQQRKEFDEIFVRESGQEQYLVFKHEDTEELWKIVDKDTLLQSNEYMTIKLKRLK
jgi:hypothetical protein